MLRGLVALVGVLSLHGVRADWMTDHMREEHFIESFDDQSFFKLHDLNNDNTWAAKDVRSLYGVERSSSGASDQTRRAVEEAVFALLPPDETGRITMDQWLAFRKGGGTLPDLGLPGHHGDEEAEFDIHHVMKYHSDPDGPSEEFWSHPEDIEHFKGHNDRFHGGKEPGTEPESLRNIPLKYRQQQ